MDTCCQKSSACPSSTSAATAGDPFAWFARMIPNCLEHARAAQEAGRPVVGIMCEFAPRELILAAGGVPVCLCGGSAAMIPPAEEHLPVNLCPLVKSTYGYHVKQANPFLEMADLIIAETTCDGKKKMIELLAERRPVHMLELPQQPDESGALERLLEEFRKLKAVLEEKFAVEICDARLRDAIRAMNRERALRRELAMLLASPTPPLTGRQLLDLKSSISAIPADFAQYEAILRLLREQSPCPGMAGRVRVLLTGVPVPHGAERVVDLIENSGGLIVAQENCTGLKPILDDVDETAPDPLRALAEKYLHLPCSVMAPNTRRFTMLRDLAATYHPDCIIELVWQACLTYDIESQRVRRLAEELSLPYLRIETDYSPSDNERIRVRVEALYETVRAS